MIHLALADPYGKEANGAHIEADNLVTNDNIMIRARPGVQSDASDTFFRRRGCDAGMATVCGGGKKSVNHE